MSSFTAKLEAWIVYSTRLSKLSKDASLLFVIYIVDSRYADIRDQVRNRCTCIYLPRVTIKHRDKMSLQRT